MLLAAHAVGPKCESIINRLISEQSIINFAFAQFGLCGITNPLMAPRQEESVSHESNRFNSLKIHLVINIVASRFADAFYKILNKLIRIKNVIIKIINVSATHAC